MTLLPSEQSSTQGESGMVRIKTVVAVGVAIVAVAGCSSGKHTVQERSALPPAPHVTAVAAATPTVDAAASIAASTAASRSASSTSASAAAGLSGTWNGHYGGSYSGTFTLNWTSTGSELSGAITLSSPGETLPIHGTVSNGRISFGTVGSTAITYTGSVSGHAMSGQYQVAAGAGGSGTWNAAKM